MRSLLIFFTLLITVNGFTQSVDVQHYLFQLKLNDDNDTIRGEATIYVKFIAATDRLSLQLTNINSAGKGMRVGRVEGNSVRGITREKDQLNIFFSKTFKAGDTASVFISYAGIPSDGLIISKNKYGHRTFFADNWPNRAHNWIPCIDDPADKATVEFGVLAPAHYQVISNGLQVEETNLSPQLKLTRYRADEQLPTKVMVIGVADFAVNLSGMVNDCIPITSWVFPENRNDGFYDYGEAPEILSWLINYIGPYPYKKLANIQSKTIFGGMENASAIFYYENSVTGRREQESLLAHEMTHQWFGNTATEKSFAHLWLSEGFATYMTHMYLESKYGRDSLDKRMQRERSEVNDFVNTTHHPVVDTTSDLMSLLNANSYQKGGWILHMLRRQLGDSVFQKCVRTYYATYAGKNADTRDLQKVFENISGKNLGVFFDQWLYKGVNPRLKLSQEYVQKDHVLLVTVEQMQSSPFVFPLEVSIDNKIEKLQVSKQSETFRIAAKQKPAQVLFDPNTALLFERVN